MRAGLVAVLAKDKATARERIREELQKPGRWFYYQAWRDSGEIIECLDEEDRHDA
jgi:hypothetical protein